MTIYSYIWAGVLLAAFLLNTVRAGEVLVSTVKDLQTAISSAAPGDTLILANGTYNNSVLRIGTSNITIKAQSPGGVFLNGSQSIKITGSYITFSGFQFTSGDIGSDNLIEVSGNHNTLTQLNFCGYSAQKYIQIAAGSQYNEISYCNIENKPVTAVIGCTIQISTSPVIPGYHKIRYCSFRNFPGSGGDFGNEPIRIGVGAEAANNSRTIVEYCYFYNTGSGDSENISVKCCENVIRFCTFDKNPDGMLVFRNGNRNIAYSNFFINGSGGIRCKEANDIFCYNNYFEQSGVSGSMDALTLMYVAPNLKNINFLHNTFINCGRIDLGGNGPESVIFANNIFVKTSGEIFTNPNGQTAWMGNIYKGLPGIPIASGMKEADPLFEMNPQGYFCPGASSPAVNQSSAGYPAVIDIANLDDDPLLLCDISGRPRPAAAALKDVGCSEYVSGTVTNRPLNIKDAGPVYLGGPLTGVSPARNHFVKNLDMEYYLSECFPNPFNSSTVFYYKVPERMNVVLEIMDIRGMKITELVNEEKNSGSYSASWNGVDKYGRAAASGLYLLYIKMGRYAQTKKMILLK